MQTDAIRRAFSAVYGASEGVRIFSAPGRVNLIGEHTDYNDGFVLPMAIERRTVVAARARGDRNVRVFSQGLGQARAFDLDRPGPRRRHDWLDYVEGTAWALEQRGVRLTGADLLVDSDVPAGAGLSSSAALEVSVALSLSSLPSARAELPSPVDLALAGQQAEHAYVGTMCGIMDQFIAALGREGHALLIDCRSLESTSVPLGLSSSVVLVCDTRTHHELASSEYNRRRAECEQGVQDLARVLPGIRALRDVSPVDFERHESVLDETVRKRCRHVVFENERTLAAAAAFGRSDLAEVGRLMALSHASLRDDYQVSCAELDCAVETALSTAGVLGARMTGGGFGGSTVNLVQEEAVPRVCEALTRALERRFGKRPALFATRASQGAMEHA